MKQFFIVILFVATTNTFALNQAITYELNGGRLGDNISTWSKAEYLSYHYSIPLLSVPFPYSDCFAFDTLETALTPALKSTFKHIIYIVNGNEIENYRDENDVLFISTFYTKTPSLYEVKCRDKEFNAFINAHLKPLMEVPIIEQSSAFTVALHVRTGGGIDAPLYSEQWYDHAPILYSVNIEDKITNTKEMHADQQWPTKFPPLQYYLDQIKKLRTLVSDKPLLIYLFTDDPDPQSLVSSFNKRLNDDTISFIYQTTHHDQTVEDLIMMSQCQCLIRSSSLYAQAAQLMGNHQIIFYPLHSYWQGKKLIIDKVKIVMCS